MAEAEWQRTRRAVFTELPAIDLVGAGKPSARPLSPDRTGAYRWPASSDDVESLRKLAALEPSRRKDAELYKIIDQLNAFEWFARLSETITFAIAGSICVETFLKSELAIIGTALSVGPGADASGRGATPVVDADAESEYFYFVLSGLLALQRGRRIAGYLYPGQMHASFANAVRSGHGERESVEVRAVEGSAVLVVTRSLFMAAMATRSDAHFRSKLAFITSVPLFSALQRKLLRPFVDRLTPERARKGDVLIKQGDAPSKLSFVLSGEARVLRHVPDSAFRMAAKLAAASAPLDALGASSGMPDSVEPTDDASLAAEAADDGSTLPGGAHAARSGAHPLAVRGQTLEIGLLGPRDFFGELAILGEASGGRARASIVALSDMRLLSMHMVDYKNTVDAATDAAFQLHARSYPTDLELVNSLSDGTHWSAYKRALVSRVVHLEREAHGGSANPALAVGDRPARRSPSKPPNAADARIRRTCLVCTDGFSTPISRAALFDMAVTSARRAAAQPPPPVRCARKRAQRPLPMPALPEIAGRVNDAAARAGLARAGSRGPHGPAAAAATPGSARAARQGAYNARSAAHWVDDPRQWDKFREWGASETSRAEYKARFEKNLRDATEALARQALEAV